MLFVCVAGKKRSRWREELWNIKYLHRFQWAHLNERLAYEKAVHSHRMRAEISQVKREANFLIENAEKSARMKKQAKKRLASGIVDDANQEGEEERIFTVRLKQTEDEILNSKKRGKKDMDGDGGGRQAKRMKNGEESVVFDSNSEPAKGKSFLTKIFAAGKDGDDSD